jgi:hypothetical protein
MESNYKDYNGTKKSNSSEELQSSQAEGVTYIVSNTQKEKILKKHKIKLKDIKKYILKFNQV